MCRVLRVLQRRKGARWFHQLGVHRLRLAGVLGFRASPNLSFAPGHNDSSAGGSGCCFPYIELIPKCILEHLAGRINFAEHT